MKALFTMVSFLLLTTSYCQERISNIQEGGDGQKHILTEVDGVNYLLKLTMLDSVETYIVANGEASLQHTVFLSGIYFDYRTVHIDRWLLVEDGFGSVAYDFVNNSEETFEFNDGRTISNWTTYGTDVISLRHGYPSTSTGQQVYLLDLDLQLLSTDEKYKYLQDATPDHYVLQSQNDNFRIYHLEDRLTGETVNTVQLPLEQRARLLGDHIYYFDKSTNEVRNIDLLAGTDDVLFKPDFTADTALLFTKENTVVVALVTSNGSKQTTLLYHHQLEKAYAADGLYLTKDEVTASKDIVLYEHGGGYLGVYDFTTDKMELLQSGSFISGTVVFDGRLILHRYITNQIYDVKNDVNKAFLQPINITLISDKTFITEGSKYYLNYISPYSESVNLLEINTDPLTVGLSDLVAISPEGLSENSFVRKYGSDVIVDTDFDFYAVKDDALVQLNEGHIVESEYRKYIYRGNGIVWAEDSHEAIEFKRFRDGQKSTIASLPNSNMSAFHSVYINKFLEGDQTLLVSGRRGFDFVTLLVNKSNGTVTEVDIPRIDPTGILFFADGYYFASSAFLLLRISESGDVDQLTNTLLPYLSINQQISHKGEHFVAYDHQLFEIVDGQPISRLVIPEGFSQALLTVSGGPLLFKANGTIYHRDEEQQWVPTILGNAESYRPLTDQYLRYQDEGVTYLYDIATDSLLAPIPELQQLANVFYFDHEGQGHLVTARGSFWNGLVVTIYRVADDFSSFETISTFSTFGRGVQMDFAAYENEGFLYVGNKLFLMNEDLELLPLEGVVGDTRSVSVVEDEGTFYFIGLESETGRQVYKMLALSLKVNTDELVGISTLRLVPNPAQDYLKLESSGSLYTQYIIYDNTGKRVQQGSATTAEIDIRALESGLYYIYCTDGRQGETGTFVKY